MYKPKPKQIYKDFYAVKETGWIPVNKLGEVLGPNKAVVELNKPTNGYVRYKGYPVHRIVALTFLEANDDTNKLQVNHKDGNKHNNTLDNLEWCPIQENCIHAYSTGLRKDNRSVEIKDLETGEVRTFYSLQSCARFFNVNGGSLYQFLNRPIVRPYGIKYDVRYSGNDWNGLTEDDIINLEERGSSKLILAIPIDKTKKSIIFNSTEQAALLFECSKGLITWYIGKNGSNGSNEYKGYNWYYLRDYSNSRKMSEDIVNSSEKILIDYKFNKNPKSRVPAKLKVTNLETDEFVIWNSLEDYATSKGILKNSLEKRIIYNNGVINGFKYEYINKTKQYR